MNSTIRNIQLVAVLIVLIATVVAFFLEIHTMYENTMYENPRYIRPSAKKRIKMTPPSAV